MNFLKAFVVNIAILSLIGCATTDIGPEDASAQVATKKLFSEYDHFLIKHVTLNLEFQDSSDYQKEVIKKIEYNLLRDMELVFPELEEMDDDGEEKFKENTLIIVPSIEKLQYVSGSSRTLWGALAGSSAIVLRTTYIDAATNEIIANPSFYQHANAMAAAYTYGSHDRKMLLRITKLAASYAANNY